MVEYLQRAKQTLTTVCNHCKKPFSQPFVDECEYHARNYETALQYEMLRLYCEDKGLNIKEGSSVVKFMKEVML